MNPQATAGRVVHFHTKHDGVRAAIVNTDATPEGEAELTVFFASGPSVSPGVLYAEEPTAGCWSWMPYQREKAERAGGNQSESAEPRPDSGKTPKSTPSSEK